ncbi:ankyrin repeat domain-containing protein 26-like [Myotis daubentonii]|uniref:ankyrin repeat domain-containing protein 26-like n=1 Tax=Myotis daubentonii TaxID=98922 RepID=UPI002873BFFD|nr:ankyrin repeat domain-containing protein 26-like [Myotis daubentonii]
MPQYREEDMRAIHKAASVGNLLRAILHDQEECAAILLDHGADPNAMDIHGNTPLHYAVLGQNTAIVEKLLSCMANPEARNEDDFTPLSLAKYENNEKMVEFLLTRGSGVHQMEGHQQPTSERKEKRRLLKSSGSNNLVRERTEEEALFRHALKVACYKGHKRVVSQLARRRRLLDLCDTDNKTALIHAIQYEQEECAAILLEHGADPNVIDIHGNTALHYAVLSENTTIVEKLVSCMANLEVRNKDDFTPLSLAKHENKEKMVEFLVTRGLKDHQVEGNQQSTSENKEERSPMKSSDSNNLGPSAKVPAYTNTSSSPLGTHGRNGLMEPKRLFGVEEEEEAKSRKRETSKSMHDGADDDGNNGGLSQHSNREQSDNQQPKDNISENAVILMNKVEEQEKKTSSKREVSDNMHDGAEENSDNVGVRQKGNMEQSEKQQVPIKEKENSHRKRRIAVACPTSDNVVFKVKEKNKQTNSKREVSENVYDAANDDSDKNGLRQQINSEQTDSQQPNGKINENTAFLVDKVKEKEKQKSSKREASENTYDGADDDNENDGLSKHSIREQTDNQHPNDNINENAVILMNKVVEQEKKTSSKREVSGNMHVGAEDNSDSVGVRQKSNIEQSEKQQVFIKEKENSHRHGFPHWCCGFFSKRRIPVACPTLDNVVFKVEGENKQRSSIKEVSGNIYEGADDHSDGNGLRHQRNSQQTDTQQSKDEINENTVFFMNKVEEKKEQKNSKREESGNMWDGANDDTDRVGVRQKSNSEQSDKLQFPTVENEDSDRLTLQEEKEKRQKADLLNKKNTGHSTKKERQSIKNVEMNPKVANTTATQVMPLKTVRRNTVVEQNYTQRRLSQEQNANVLQDGILTKHLCKPKVSDSDEKEKRLLRENRMLKNKIAMLTLELDTVKNQNPEMVEKKDFLDIVIVKEKIDHFEKTITETLFQNKAELEGLRADLTMLSSKLEDERQNRGRLEAEGESHRSRRATVVQDHEHCQTLKGDLQVDFKKEKEEWICSQDKNKSDISNLKCDFEILSQKFSILESKYNRLEIELHHTRDALRERALVLEDGERDQSQTQCQKGDSENVSQKEQGKVNADIGKQESLQERLSHLQSENKLLQQQLDRAHNKSEKKRKTVIRTQDQFVDTIKILQANSEKQGLMLNETCKELINECHLFKESRLHYENDKAERDAVVRRLQGELADTQRKLRQLQGELDDTQGTLRQLQGELADSQRRLFMTDASLKIESHRHLRSQYKIQELQKELHESRSQCQHEKEESKKYIDLTMSLQQSLHEVMKQKSDLEKSMARFQEPLNMPKGNLNEDLSFPRDLRPSLTGMGMQTSRLIQESEEPLAASTSNHSPEDNTAQLEEEFKVLLRKCEEMTARAECWKQEGLRVRRQMQINRAKHLEEEQRLDRIGECSRPDIAYRSEQIRQFYQDFFAL